jgi:membrane-associated phospholipid phosphatase
MQIKEILYDWNGLNANVFHFFNKLITKGHVASEGLVYFSELATIFALPYMAGFALFIFLIHAYFNKLHQNQDEFKNQILLWSEAFAIIFLTLSAAIFIGPALKQYFGYIRPLCFYPEGDINIIPELHSGTISKMLIKRCSGDGSFPSMHSTIAAVITIGFWSLSNVFFRSVLIAYSLLIALSRLVIGVHYPADLIGGYILGFVIFIAIKLTISHTKKRIFQPKAFTVLE